MIAGKSFFEDTRLQQNLANPVCRCSDSCIYTKQPTCGLNCNYGWAYIHNTESIWPKRIKDKDWYNQTLCYNNLWQLSHRWSTEHFPSPQFPSHGLGGPVAYGLQTLVKGAALKRNGNHYEISPRPEFEARSIWWKPDMLTTTPYRYIIR